MPLIVSWILRLLMPVHVWRFISSAILDLSRRKGKVVTLIYYIRTSKGVSLGERLRPQGERLRPQDERLLPQHGTLGEKIPPQGKMYHGKHGTFEIESQPKSRNELLRELPKGLQERVAKLGKWASREKVSQLLVDLCAFKPYSYEELALIIQRAAKPMKDKYIKPLRLANKLFYWIPEMINHPLQKYVADPSMARSNTKKLDNKDK